MKIATIDYLMDYMKNSKELREFSSVYDFF
jgi:hypothetical protein